MCERTSGVSLISGDTSAAAADFLARAGLSVGGVSSRRLVRRLCEDAVRRPGEVALLLARDGAGTPAGAVVCLARGRRYWRGFLLRHPWVALAVAARIVLRRLWPARRIQPAPPRPVAIGPAAASPDHPAPDPWKGDAPFVLLIAVASECRNRGTGRLLYEALFHHVQGTWKHRRILALISRENAPSVRLHRATGWCLHPCGGNWLGHKEVPEDCA